MVTTNGECKGVWFITTSQQSLQKTHDRCKQKTLQCTQENAAVLSNLSSLLMAQGKLHCIEHKEARVMQKQKCQVSCLQYSGYTCIWIPWDAPQCYKELWRGLQQLLSSAELMKAAQKPLVEPL